MHDAAFVCISQTLRHLSGNRKRLPDRQLPMLANQLAQFLTVEEFHGHISHVTGITKIIDGDDIGVTQAADGFGFLIKACFVLLALVIGQQEVDRLDGDNAIEDRVSRFVDDAHRTASQFRDYFVAAEFLWFHSAIHVRESGVAGLSEVLMRIIS